MRCICMTLWMSAALFVVCHFAVVNEHVIHQCIRICVSIYDYVSTLLWMEHEQMLVASSSNSRRQLHASKQSTDPLDVLFHGPSALFQPRYECTRSLIYWSLLGLCSGFVCCTQGRRSHRIIGGTKKKTGGLEDGSSPAGSRREPR